MKRKVLAAILLSLAMAATAAAWGLAACDKRDELEFFEYGDGYAVSGVDNFDKKIVIPQTYEGKPVTAIADGAFKDFIYLREITIPSTVTEIGEYAFSGCISLADISLPSTVKEIGDYSFEDCSFINFALPESLIALGEGAFDGCTRLSNAAIPSGISQIPAKAFSGCGIISLTLPENVTSVGDYAFSDCDLDEVTLSDGVRSLGEGAFDGCDELTEIVIPDGVTTIGKDAFRYCDLLIIYSGLGQVPAGWDSGWNGTRPIIWDCENNDRDEDGNAYIEVDDLRYAVNGEKCAAAAQLDRSAQLAEIAASVTYNGQSYAVTEIGDYAFSDCTVLRSVSVPDSVTAIGDYAFATCRRLETIALPDGVEAIGEGAFISCMELDDVIIPVSVTDIGRSAFSGCTGLNLYCEAASQPAGWADGWNGSSTVVWGYTGA